MSRIATMSMNANKVARVNFEVLLLITVTNERYYKRMDLSYSGKLRVFMSDCKALWYG